MKKKLTRRVALSSLGLISGGLLASGCSKGLVPQVSAETVSQGSEANNSKPASEKAIAWKYVPLDPEELADRAYAIYTDGGCMYSVVASVVATLAERYGEPYSQFPCAMMRYGQGGLARWGSLCGIVNGAGAVVGLFYPDDGATREKLISAFACWYESTELPVYQPKDNPRSVTIPRSVARSILCHRSMGEWCEASGYSAFSNERGERCRRLAADGVKKLVELLNDAHAQSKRALIDISPEAEACNSCHGKEQRADAMVKMNCHSCHEMPDSHGEQGE